MRTACRQSRPRIRIESRSAEVPHPDRSSLLAGVPAPWSPKPPQHPGRRRRSLQQDGGSPGSSNPRRSAFPRPISPRRGSPPVRLPFEITDLDRRIWDEGACRLRPSAPSRRAHPHSTGWAFDRAPNPGIDTYYETFGCDFRSELGDGRRLRCGSLSRPTGASPGVPDAVRLAPSISTPRIRIWRSRSAPRSRFGRPVARPSGDDRRRPRARPRNLRQSRLQALPASTPARAMPPTAGSPTSCPSTRSRWPTGTTRSS